MDKTTYNHHSQGLSAIEVIVVVAIVVVVFWIVAPVFERCTTPAHPRTCYRNLKELAVSLNMYWADYNGMLPSSILHDPLKSKKWDPVISAEFCSEKGQTPPPKIMTPDDVRGVQLLYPHMKNKDVIWCPFERNMVTGNSAQDQRAMVSYIYKPAVDRAWFGSMYPIDPAAPTKNLQMKCFRRVSDFEHAADQMIFFERVGYHWGDEKKGWSEGVNLNAAFLDGHVRSVRLKNAINKPSPKDSTELAKYLMMDGEPMYYNYAPHSTDPAKGKHIQGQCCDPRIYCDNLP